MSLRRGDAVENQYRHADVRVVDNKSNDDPRLLYNDDFNMSTNNTSRTSKEQTTKSAVCHT